MRPDIEQFKRTLRRQKAAHIPIAELGVHPKIKAKVLGRPIQHLQDDVDFWHGAGYDYIKLQPLANFNPAGAGLEGRVRADEDRAFTRTWAAEGEGVITSHETFEQYQFPRAEDFDYQVFENVGALLPEGMGVIGQYGDIFTMTWDSMGLEIFSEALYDDPELVQRVIDAYGELVLSMFRYFAESDVVDVLWFSDDIAYTEGLMVSPTVLRRYFFPWLKKIGDLARAANKPLIYHSDGVLYPVFDDIIACGVTAVHPIEPKAMDMAEVKARVGDRLALVGNIDVDLLARGTPEQVRAQVRELIDKLGPDGGYCIGSGNSIPEYVKTENYLAMIETVKALDSAYNLSKDSL